MLSGHGYVDIKNMELMSKLSQQKSLMGQGSHLLLPMNQDIPQIEMFRSASKEQMQTNASKGSIVPFNPSDLGSLINSPTTNLYKTSVKIKGGQFGKTSRMNN